MIDENLYNILTTKTYEKLSCNLINKLKERKYLFDTPEDETNFVNYLINQITQTGSYYLKPPTIYLCITYDCNLKCNYCNEKDYVFPGHKTYLTAVQIDAVFDALSKLVSIEDLRKRPLILYGGEPLIESTYDVVEYIFKRIRDMQLPLVIVTNGFSVDNFWSIIHSLEPQMLTFIITLDGPKGIHDVRRPQSNGSGSFDKIVKNIDLLLKSNFRVEVQSILDKQNIGYLPEFCDFIIAKGWHTNTNCRFFIGRTMFTGNSVKYDFMLSEEEFVRLLFEQIGRNPHIDKIFKKFTSGLQIAAYLNSLFVYGYPPIPKFTGCRACTPGLYAFCPDNYIYPCLELINLKEFAIGKFYPKLVWDRKKLEPWRYYNILNDIKCQKCKYLFICRGGCPAQRMIGINKCPHVPQIIDAFLGQILTAGSNCLKKKWKEI